MSENGKRPVEKRKLVFIEWEDAAGPTDAGWEHVRNLSEHSGYRCWSVGWVMDNGKTHISLAPHFGNIDKADDEQVCGLMHIPRAMIRKMRTLKVP